MFDDGWEDDGWGEYYTSETEPVPDAKLLNNKESLSQDILSHLEDPEFSDVKIVASDGEIPAKESDPLL